MTATIVDSDAGTDPDDTAVAILVARAADHLGVQLMVSNDETTTLAKARFLAHVMRLAGAPHIRVAAGLPSNKQRTSDLADAAGLVPLADPARPIERDAVERIVEVLDANDRVVYVGLGALSNLDAALQRRPELADRIRLFQMGPALVRGFARGRAQYNARIDPIAFRRVLERVPEPTLVATHTTWGAPAPAPPLGVYPDDDIARAMAVAATGAADRPDLRLYLQHLAAFVESGKDCSILHDPATLLAATGSAELFDFVEVEIAIDDDGWLHLTADCAEQLRALSVDRCIPIATALNAWEAAPSGSTVSKAIRARLSLRADQPRLRQRIASLLLSAR